MARDRWRNAWPRRPSSHPSPLHGGAPRRPCPRPGTQGKTPRPAARGRWPAASSGLPTGVARRLHPPGYWCVPVPPRRTPVRCGASWATAASSAWPTGVAAWPPASGVGWNDDVAEVNRSSSA
ncbi:unnamed protein product [Musa acuminata var. zebrina]